MNLGYKAEEMTIEEAKSAVTDYSFALLYKISELRLCEAKSLRESDWDQCYEARLFREDEEIHLMIAEGRAVRITDSGDEDVLVKEYVLGRAGCRDMGLTKGSLISKQYLEADEDGQMTVVVSRLAAIR